MTPYTYYTASAAKLIHVYTMGESVAFHTPYNTHLILFSNCHISLIVTSF